MDRDKCLQIGNNGITEIVKVEQDIYNKILDYFKVRNEDGV
jgi:hypothetical protein